MKCVFESIQWIDYFAEKFHIPFDNDNRYYTALYQLKQYLAHHVVRLDSDERDRLVDFLYSLEIPCLQDGILDIVGGNADKSCLALDDLNDTQLVLYFVNVMSTITYNQNGNLLLMKYNIAIWNTGFHKMAKFCRGAVIRLDSHEVVSHPFDKFFNLNEAPESQQERVEKLLHEARYVYATDKIDGSTISVVKYNGEMLITTNGSFENDQIKWAAEMFSSMYPLFAECIEECKTYIFELVHPLNRIVLDYHGEKALYLLNIRDLHTNTLLPMEDVHRFAELCGFPVPEVYDFNDLSTLVHLAHTMKDANKEGWVIRIGHADGETMLKLKLDEYFAMHQTFGKVKLGWVYKHLLAGDLDDFLSVCTDNDRIRIDEKLSDIRKIQQRIRNDVVEEAERVLSAFGLTLNTFAENRETMVSVISSVLKSSHPYKHFILSYIKNPPSLETQIQKIFYKHMKVYAETYGYSMCE